MKVFRPNPWGQSVPSDIAPVTQPPHEVPEQNYGNVLYNITNREAGDLQTVREINLERRIKHLLGLITWNSIAYDPSITWDDFINYFDNASGIVKKATLEDILWSMVQDVFTPTIWQTSFTLSSVPRASLLLHSRLVVNEASLDYWLEYTIAGTTLTFNPLIAWYDLDDSDTVVVYYLK